MREETIATTEKLGALIQQNINEKQLRPEDLVLILPPGLYSQIRLIYEIPLSISLRILGVVCYMGNVGQEKALLTEIREEITL
jgi:hypothetical protein